jgi:hypothetical protein
VAKYDTYIKLKASNGETSDNPIILIVIKTKHNPLNYIKKLDNEISPSLYSFTRTKNSD